MLGNDLLIIMFCLLQPPFIGFLLFSITKQGLLSKQIFNHLRFVRKKFKSARYFECASAPRLVGRLSYDIQVLSFVLIFIVYDVDLIMFYSEATAFEYWSWSQLFLFSLYALFFFMGLYYDIKLQKIRWAY